MSKSILFTNPSNEFEVRSNIILRYFLQWSGALVNQIKSEALEEKFAFVDLAAGWNVPPSCPSIAHKILTLAASKTTLREMLFSIINDKDEEAIAEVTSTIANIKMIETMGFPPLINLSNIDDKVSTALSSIHNLPTLALVELWGYQGCTTALLDGLVRQHKADCLLLFDYKSICRSINKKSKQEALIRVFGQKITQDLQEAFKVRLSPFKKEKILVKAFKDRLKDQFGKAVFNPLVYKFYDHKNKTSHFLFFLTQNKAAYTLMREIFCAESQIIEDGIGNLAFNPNKGSQQKISSQTLFGSMFKLEQELLQTYKSQTLQIIDIYENHHLGRALVKKNYIDALLNLEKKNQITVTRKRHLALHERSKQQLHDKVFVSFNK